MSRPPTPPPDAIDLNAIANPTNESTETLSAPTALFQSDPSTIDSFLSEQCIHPAMAIGREKRKSHASIATSPSRPKRRATSSSGSSPCRTAIRAVVRAAASCIDATNPVPRRVSPPSVVQSVFDPPPPEHTARRSNPSKGTAPKGRSRTMLGLIPKTEFLQEFRPAFWTKTELTPNEFDKDLKDKRKWMNAHFQWWDTRRNNDDNDDAGPKLRSSNEDYEDWVIDSEGINVETTNQRRLSRYCIEQLWVTKHKTKLLVLVSVADDVELYGGIGAAVEKVQRIERANISGREYYRLKCSVTSSTHDKLVYGEKSGTYSRAQFERDVGESRNGDLGVTFEGTNEKMSFNWYEIITQPSSLMFFGAPLTQSRAFECNWRWRIKFR